MFGLTDYTQSNAWNRLAPRLRDRLLALFALVQTLTARQSATGEIHRIINARINLILHCTIPRPATRHALTLITLDYFKKDSSEETRTVIVGFQPGKL